MKIIAILLMASLLFMSCAHIPQPPSYGEPDKDRGGIGIGTYEKCKKCGVVFKTYINGGDCPKCETKKWWHVNFKGRVTALELSIIMPLVMPVLILAYMFAPFW